ncbi:DMT family transporter [Pararhodospirillum oryzae]|nr:DMT family transporter [Pararhodospirillum oryzae]
MTSPNLSIDRPGRAIACMIGAMAFFALMDAQAKLLGASLPVPELVFFRLIGGLLVVAPLYFRQPAPQRRLVNPGLLAVRAGLGLAGVALYFAALTTLGMAEVAAVSFAAPFLVTALGALALHEPVSRRHWIALLVGFAGMLVILRPGGGVVSSGGLLALAGALAYALLIITLRIQGRVMTSITSAFWFLAVAPFVVLPLLPVVWVTPTWDQAPWLLGLGIAGGLGQILLTMALRLAPASTVAPFDYTYLVWATGLGWFLFGDFPDRETLLGLPLVIGAGLVLLRRDRETGP